MITPSQARARTILVAAAIAVLVLGLLSAVEAPHRPYTGYSLSGARVTTVDDGSPALAAGLRAGDVVKSVNGVPTTDPRTTRRALRRRPVAGETWPMTVERAGQLVLVQLIPERLRPSDVARARSLTVLGFCFVAFTLWAFLVSPGPATTVLAVAGLSFGFVGLGTPYSVSSAIPDVVEGMATLAFFAGFATIVHFLLVFPTRRPFLKRRWGPLLLYGPAMLLVLLGVGNLLLPIDLRLGGLGTVVLLLYFLGALALLVRLFVATPQSERRLHGINVLIGTTVVVVLPFLFFAIVPGWWPASRRAYDLYSPYAAATFGLIPIALSVAAVRSAGSRSVSS